MFIEISPIKPINQSYLKFHQNIYLELRIEQKLLTVKYQDKIKRLSSQKLIHSCHKFILWIIMLYQMSKLLTAILGWRSFVLLLFVHVFIPSSSLLSGTRQKDENLKYFTIFRGLIDLVYACWWWFPCTVHPLIVWITTQTILQTSLAIQFTSVFLVASCKSAVSNTTIRRFTTTMLGCARMCFTVCGLGYYDFDVFWESEKPRVEMGAK